MISNNFFIIVFAVLKKTVTTFSKLSLPLQLNGGTSHYTYSITSVNQIDILNNNSKTGQCDAKSEMVLSSTLNLLLSAAESSLENSKTPAVENISASISVMFMSKERRKKH